MNAHINDLIDRTDEALQALPDLHSDALNARPAGHPNSIAWLLWHTGREIDVQLADLTGEEQIWTAAGHRDRLNLGEAGDGFGYGHTAGEAAAIRTDDQEGLTAYVAATLTTLREYADWVGGGQGHEWDDVIDDNWDPPVDRGTRVVSMLIDAIQHLAQAQYVAGAPKLA